MTKRMPSRPPATPETQTAPAAHAGGTYGQGDFSKSAKRSASRTTKANPVKVAGSDD
jgi:hypothetical protein